MEENPSWESSRMHAENRDDEESIGLLAEYSEQRPKGVRSRSSSFANNGLTPQKVARRSKTPSRLTQTGIIVSFIIVLALIMIWDMNKMYQISEMIHDDHNSLWEPMNDTSLRTWWSPLDICLLKMNDSNIDVKTYRAKNCNKLSGLNLSPSNEIMVPKLFCNAGSSLGKACPPPLSNRNYFSYRLRDPRYRNGRSTYLSDALKLLAKKKMPLVFVGDGLSKQNEDALICDLLRTDGPGITVLTGLAYLQQSLGASFNRSALTNAMIPDYVVKWKGLEKFPLEIKYFKLWAVEDDSGGTIRLKKKRNRARYLHHSHAHDVNVTGGKQYDHTNWLADSPLSREIHRLLYARKSNYSAANGLSTNYENIRANSSISSRTKESKTAPNRNRNVAQYALQRRIENNLASGKSNNRTSTPVSNTGENSIPPKFSSVNRTANAGSSNSSKISPGGINYNAQATPTIRLSFQQVQLAIEQYITQQKRAVALIANLGVFYNSREKFREEVPFFLSWLHHLQEERIENLIFYRETAAQHWNHTDTGYYDESYREESENNGTCVPIADNRLGMKLFILLCNKKGSLITLCFSTFRFGLAQ